MRELLALLLVHKGGPIKKLWVAETLWPAAQQQQAMDSLYKVIRFWKKEEKLNTFFPLENRTNELELKTDEILCDIWSFEEEAASEEIGRMEAAAARYSGPLLFQEYYEWTAEQDAYYEVRFTKLLEALTEHFGREGDMAKCTYYQKKQDRILISDFLPNEF